MKPRPSTNKSHPFHFLAPLDRLPRPDAFTLGALVISFVAAALIIVFALEFDRLFPRYDLADFRPAGTAPYELVPERDIVWVDEEKTEKKRAEAERNTFPVFHYDEEQTTLILKKFGILRDFVMSRKTTGHDDPAAALRHQNLGVSRLLTDRSFASLLALSAEDLMRLFENTDRILHEALDSGILSWTGIDRDPVSLSAVAVVRTVGATRVVSEKTMNDIITLQSLPFWLDNRLAAHRVPERLRDQGRTIVLALADENVRFSETATAASRQKARETVPPVRDVIRKNYPIVGKGQTISNESYARLLAFRRASETETANRIAGTLMFLAIIFLTAVLLLGRTFGGRTLARGELLFSLSLGLAYLALSVLAYRLLPPEGEFPLSLVLPTATITVIATIIISPYAGIAYSFILAAVALLIQNELPVFLFAFFSGLAGTAAAARAQQRIDLVKAGFVLAAAELIIMLVIGIMAGYARETVFTLGLAAALNGFLSLIASLGFLPLFEHALNAPTRFRLMELSDPNVPILKKMLVLAPGTYTHSINVANLAESASMAIGANAPLSRVGAYYHDVGKVDQPEYFIENQNAFNKHDLLKPSLSAAVIKSHLKIGVERAKELDLPQAVIDIIAQHHGKGLISYFFSRARAEMSGDETVNPEDFSYQGTRPQTREAAIVMLADAVEAASRSLKKPTPAKIERLVWQIIEERFHSEELLECSLTLHDLDVIKRVFVQIVQGYLHQRIEYPKTRENGA